MVVTLLVIDTSTGTSVAIVDGDRVLAERTIAESRSHAEVVGRDDVYGWLTRQMARIDTIEVGAETYALRMSTGTERRPDRLNFIDLNEHITLYVDVNVPAAFATIGVLMRIPGLPACAEKWSGPVTIQRK